MSCVLCVSGCKYCNPNIPKWYLTAVASKHRTHAQVVAVMSGYHPSGNEEGLGESIRCGDCKHALPKPGYQLYKHCAKAVSEDTRLVTVYMHGCSEYKEAS